MTSHLNRRGFLTSAATLAGTAAFLNQAGRGNAQHAYGEIVETQDFARLEKLSDNIWAVVSTPVDADGNFQPETVCNGGLIAGEDRVVAIDAFLQPAGSAWLSQKALDLTGRPITDVIVTHFHADHSGGLAGFQNGATGPEIIATETTRKLIYERYAAPARAIEGTPFSAPQGRIVLPTRILTDETQTASMDIGGRTLTLDPKKGHTPSDLAIHVEDSPVIFAGDLVWGGFFHNYVDAIPSYLTASVKDLLKDPNKTIVTGHGHIAKAADLGDYVSLLELVEDKARAAHAAGKSAEDGAKDFSIPESLGPWVLFSPTYYQVAFEAWYKELDGETG